VGVLLDSSGSLLGQSRAAVDSAGRAEFDFSNTLITAQAGESYLVHILTPEFVTCDERIVRNGHGPGGGDAAACTLTTKRQHRKWWRRWRFEVKWRHDIEPKPHPLQNRDCPTSARAPDARRMEQA